MSNSTNQNVITQYLFGTLPEGEQERLDELSVTSPEFVESLSATENDLIDSYVQGELSGAMLAQFESHYLASAVRHERVEFAEAFHVFAARQTATDDSSIRGQIDLKTKRKGGFLSTLSIFGGRYPVLQRGLAAAAVVFIAAGAFLLLQTARLRQQVSVEQARRDELQQHEMQLQKELDQQRASNATIEQELAQLREDRARMEQELKTSGPRTSGTAIVSFVLTPQMRGAGQLPSVKIGPDTESVAAHLTLDPNDFPAYRVALIDQANHHTLWSSGILKVRTKGDTKVLTVTFPAGRLKPQSYGLRVSGIGAGAASELISDYPFRVVK